ncbi:MAG TPA: TlpA disulfide reductase family protein [Chitinophagaceae bacterium]
MKFFFIFFVILITACNGNKKDGSSLTTIPATEIEKIKLAGLTGNKIDLKQYKGKTVFINFWATWCKPCVLEMPTIRNAIDLLKNHDIEFLFASDEDPDVIRLFEKKHGYQFNYCRVNNIEELGITILPTTFIFDKEGRQVYSEIGYQKWDDSINMDLLLKYAGK